MNRKKEKTPDVAGELIRQPLRESGGPQALFDKGGLLDQLKKRLIETALEGELDEHLGYPKHQPIEPNSGNSRNGHGKKTIIVDNDQFEINPPRDRNGSFEPQLIPKRQTRFKGFDEKILDKAENKNWILFFDEADTLFGKRTDIRDAHDKYANQETAYLLQRIEGHNGLVILASNKRGNLDEAFSRRFQSIIHFPMPRAEERHALWLNTLPGQMSIDAAIDWHDVASRYELSGAGILNIVHYCAIESLANPKRPLDNTRLEQAILREFIKEGKVV